MDGQICQYYKYGYCKFKKHSRKIHEHGECDALAKCKNIKICNKRHPKTCQRLSKQKFCKFGLDCAYLHRQVEQEAIERHEESVEENIKIMKAEISVLKKTRNEMVTRDSKRSELIESVQILQEEIKDLKIANAEIVQTIKSSGKELENETKELDLEVECSIKESDTREQQIEFNCNGCSY